ncbi:MAG TPA: MoxR family ATPase [bacterium]|nr:MoxR family ATPase [bacterium]HQO35947.1 MoxR family ATPase [bacterium]
MNETIATTSDYDLLQEIHQRRDLLITEICKQIVGQARVIEELLISLFAGGHVLLMGVPGLAKTTLIQTLARILDLSFKRIQFTPDLMPSDITGTEVLEENRSTGERQFRFIPGPLFANIVLADEINRTPPKTQAALLEAMQEYRVTAGGIGHDLKRPFFVLATQNPIEQEGTYPLPEAQLDRFMFQVNIDYPSEQEEVMIVENTTSAYMAKPQTVMTGEEVLRVQDLIRKVPASEDVISYAVRLVSATRPNRTDGASGRPESVNQYVSWGAGPRASQYLVLGGKVRAVLDGRTCLSREDIRSVVEPVLRHRIILNFRAEADRIDVHRVIRDLKEWVKE